MSNSHCLPIRIYWEDTDAAGIVYYANYLRFLERGRSDLLRRAGINQATLMDSEGSMFPVRRCEIDYLKPARLDDQIEVHTHIKKIGGATIEMDQDILRSQDSIVMAKIRLAYVGPGGQPRRLPMYIRAALNEIPIVS